VGAIESLKGFRKREPPTTFPVRTGEGIPAADDCWRDRLYSGGHARDGFPRVQLGVSMTRGLGEGCAGFHGR
jgi:hypothetical protein